HLFGLDAAAPGDHRRTRTVNDIQHFGMLEDQRTQAFGRLGLANAQIERVQVHVAGVLDRPAVQVAAQLRTHPGAVEQRYLVTHATTQRLVVGGLELIHMAGLHRRMQVAVLEVAVDAVPGHTALDDLVAAPAQVPDEVVHLVTQGFAHLLAHGLVTGQAAGDLPAVAPTGAPADLVGLHHGYLEATLGQFHCRGDAGEAATDDGHVDGHAALQRRVVGLEIERRRVIGRRALGGGFDRLLDRVHCMSLGCARTDESGFAAEAAPTISAL